MLCIGLCRTGMVLIVFFLKHIQIKVSFVKTLDVQKVQSMFFLKKQHMYCYNNY